MRSLLRPLSIIIFVNTLFLLVPIITVLIYNEQTMLRPLIYSIIISGTLAVALYLGGFKREDLKVKESFIVVGLGWLLSAFFGALPFHLSGATSSFVDAYFEAMSGFTTTGATIFTDIEVLPKGVLFWRSFTHWLGGMGIVVLFVAVLPHLRSGGEAALPLGSSRPNGRRAASAHQRHGVPAVAHLRGHLGH